MNTAIFDRRLAEMKKTKKNMSDDLGIIPQRLSDMRAGRLKGYKYQRKIAQYLGVEQDLLFPENGEQEPCHNKSVNGARNSCQIA